MDRNQMQQLIQQAAVRGDDVVINISAHVVTLLRGLADEIEAGKQTVGVAELQMLRDRAPWSTYVVSVKDA